MLTRKKELTCIEDTNTKDFDVNATTSERTFVLGVGAQKAGTTWLHEYLNSCDEARMGVAKEYHIWNALHHDLCANRKLTPRTIFRTKSYAPFLPYPSRELTIRYLMQRFDGFYERYFWNLARGRIRITGDVTPCYAGLAPQTLECIKRRVENKGFRMKIVFLMRDPVERCWSAVRHQRRVSALSDKKSRAESEADHLRRVYKTEQMQFRTRYQETIENLESVFPREDIWLGIFETLFTRPEVRRLSDFLNIAANQQFTENKVQVSPKTESSLDDETGDMVKEFYSDVYVYCNKRFPETEQFWR